MYKYANIDRNNLTPEEALTVLKEGNERFVNNLSIRRDLLSIVNMTREQQRPFAAVIGCSDSRTATEIIFDQGLGDIFSVRLAGNIASDFAVASVEYSCKYLGCKLVMVLGHTKCGAVRAACDGYEGGLIGRLVSNISPAVDAGKQLQPHIDYSSQEFINSICHDNVKLQVNALMQKSEIIRDLLEKKQIGIAAGVYDIETGHVVFREDLQKF